MDLALRYALLSSFGRAVTDFASIARSFGRFLKNPRIMDRDDARPALSSYVITANLLGLSLVVTAVFALVALPCLLMDEAKPGDHIRELSSGPTTTIVLAMVVLGPLVEEVMFRGWLSGTWRSVIGSALFLWLSFGIPPLADGMGSISATLIQSVLAMIGLIGFGVLSPIDAGKRLPYFEKAFPYLFWMQGLLFGALHFQNISTSSPIVTALAVVPLVLCGWIWGFARVRLGLWSAVILHAAYNIPAVVGLLAYMVTFR